MSDSRLKTFIAKFLAWSGMFVVLLLSLPLPAHAYIDASTGSMLLQVLLGGAAGVAVAVKMLIGRFRLRRGAANDEFEAPPETEIDPQSEAVAARRSAGMPK